MRNLRFPACVPTLSTLILIFVISGCKKNEPGSTLKNGISGSAGTVKMDIAAFFKPANESGAALITPEAATNILKKSGIELTIPAEAIGVLLPENESLFLAKDGLDVSPIASFKGGKVFEWSTTTPAFVEGNNVKFSGTNISYKHEANAEADDSVEPYFIYPVENNKYIAVSHAEHGSLSNGSLRKSGNKIYHSNGNLILEFKQVSTAAWVVEGSWNDGLICNGSVIWAKGGKYFAATKQFGRTMVTSWEDAGFQLQMAGILKDVTIPTELGGALRPCSQNAEGSAENFLAKLEYDNSFGFVAEDGAAVDYDFNVKNFQSGKKVRFPGDNSIWILLEQLTSRPAFALNYNKTFAGPDGGSYSRIYSVKKGGSAAPITEIGLARNYVVAAATRIQELNAERFKGISLAAEYQETAREYLRIAEVKANQVGAGFDEWYKPVTAVFATFVGDVALNKLSKGKVLGVDSGKESLGKAAVTLANRSSRLLAATYITALQGLALTAPVVAANFDRKTFDQHIASGNEITGYTGLTHGLRSWFPQSSRASIPLIFVSGIAMRWRKMKIEEKNGLENRRQVLNLAAGGATAIAQVLATGKGPGAVGAIGSMGVLTSEIISGRGTPGVILGTTIEAGTNLLCKHPAIRPFAITLAGQVSALTQLGDAWRVGKATGEKLEVLRELKVEQVQKFNGILFILRNNPKIISDLSLPELMIVMSTLMDPYAGFRTAMGVNSVP